MPPKPFNPTQDIPSLTNKVILITGGTAGLGAGSVTELFHHNPQQIIFTGRNSSRAQSLISNLQTSSPHSPTILHFLPCDISSFASVREAAARILATTSRLDIIMLNAGIMATPAAVSVDGYQNEFATNHLGHALLVHLLLPLLRSTAAATTSDVRIINMTSVAYKQAPGIDFATLKTAQSTLGNALLPGHRWSRYGQSKLAQLLYSRELAKRHPELTSVSVHPGYVMTGLFDGLPFLTALPVMMMSLGRKTRVEEGHFQQCWAATCEKGELRNGGYYEPLGVLTAPATRLARDDGLAAELWEWTQRQFE